MSTTLAGKKVGRIGFGLMNFTWREPQVEDEQAFEVMRTAVESGANLWDGAIFFGPPESNSCQLVARYFAKYPDDADKVVISMKAGIPEDPSKSQHDVIDGSAKNMRNMVEKIIKLFDGKKHLDVFQPSRVDPNTPTEITVKAIQEYVDAGKVTEIHLCEAAASTIRRAAKVAKIGAVEAEFSMFGTEILHNGVAAACKELNIPIIAYSPLGRGFLTGQLKSRDDIPEGDPRLISPQFSEENFPKNMKLAERVREIAKSKGCTPAQLAIAWVLSYSDGVDADGKKMPTIIPIPGATKKERLLENLAAEKVKLSADERKELDQLTSQADVSGGKFPDEVDGLGFGESPELK